MRRTTLIAVLLVLALAECEAKNEQATAPAPPATLALSRAGGALPGPSAPPPTPVPPAASRSASPAASGPDTWPAFWRTLDFGTPAGNSYEPRALGVHPGLGRLYARAHARDPEGTGLVAAIDLATGQVVAIARTGPDPYAEGTLLVDAGRGRVYTANPGDGSCTVLDAATLRPVTTLEGVARLALDESAGRLYVAGPAGLHVLDADSYDVQQETPLPAGREPLALAVDPAAGRLYLAHREAAGYGLQVYDTADLALVAGIALPGPPDGLVADPGRGRAYLTLSVTLTSALWIVDTEAQPVEQRALGELSRAVLAVDRAGRRLFVGREGFPKSRITILDLDTGAEAGDIPLDQPPQALAWDEKTGRLYASHPYAHRVSAVDPERGRMSAVFPTAVELQDLKVDPARGHVYVTDTAGRLHVLDSDTGRKLATLPGGGRIAVDGPHGRLYTGGAGADRVRVFDADKLQQIGEIATTAAPVADAHSGGLYLVQSGVYLASLETMTITGAIPDTLPQMPGYSPNPAAVDAVVDPGSGRLFAIINNGIPGSNNGNFLYVYEPPDYRKVLTDTERTVVYVDVDPATGRAYVSRAYMNRRSTGLLEDGRAYTARVDGLYGALRVDPALERLYVTHPGEYGEAGGMLLILDARTLDALGAMPIPQGLILYALDAERHLLYLASADGRVQIWSATGQAPPAPAVPVRADLGAVGPARLILSPGSGPLFAVGEDQRLYRSADEGGTWERVAGGLPDRAISDVAISPGFARDQTLFAAVAGYGQGFGIWKSADGGQSWRLASVGLTDLEVSALLISPDFPQEQDRTLFALARQGGLFRSTDAGEIWQSLTGRYATENAYRPPPTLLALSPTYGRDHTLFVNHEGLQRSQDGGETWTHVFPEMGSLAFSPGYATDRTVFGWSGGAGLLRSTDGGETWVPASAGLTLSGYGGGRVLVSPDYATSRTLYFIWSPGAPESPPEFYRSRDGAAHWERLRGRLPEAATPLELAADGQAFLALDEAGRLVRFPIAGLAWEGVQAPDVNELAVNHVVLSPAFERDQTLYAVTEASSILRSTDGGRTWSDTGFPIRITSGLLPELAILPSGRVLAGTPLGLYRSDAGGPWQTVGSGLPSTRSGGLPITRLTIGPDGSLRIRVGEELAERARLFASTDEGETWTEPVPPLPIYAPEEFLSPAFATDRTAFLFLLWQAPMRSIGGGEWEAFGPPSDSDPLALQVSPAVDRDGLLFLRLEDGTLWRSTDRGDTWTEIEGPWRTEPPAGVLFSPAYGQDRVLLADARDAVYRSTDQGLTWSRVLDLESPAARVVFSPDYGQSGIIYVQQARRLFRSGDRGQTWQALPPAPWRGDEEVRLILSPAHDRDGRMLAWTALGWIYKSTDGGQTWQEAIDGLPRQDDGSAVELRQIVFPPAAGYEQNPLVFLVPYGRGLFKSVDWGPWFPVTEEKPPATAAPTRQARETAGPTPRPAPTTTPLPQPTPTPAVCVLGPMNSQDVSPSLVDRLGRPTGDVEAVFLAAQAFERGRMIWDSSTKQIYVLLNAGTWQAFADTFVEGVDPETDPALPPPPRQPKRGFGKVWRDRLGGANSAIGWALAEERGLDSWKQPFERGLLVWTDDIPPAGRADLGTYTLLSLDGTWQACGAE